MSNTAGTILSNKSRMLLYSVSLQHLPNFSIILFATCFQPLSAKSKRIFIFQGIGFFANFLFFPKTNLYSCSKKSQCVKIVDSLIFKETCNGPRRGIKLLIIFGIFKLL